MSFGLYNTPAIFQTLISFVIEGLDKFTVLPVDVILIYSDILEDYLFHIQQVFDTLRLNKQVAQEGNNRSLEEQLQGRVTSK